MERHLFEYLKAKGAQTEERRRYPYVSLSIMCHLPICWLLHTETVPGKIHKTLVAVIVFREGD